MGLVTISGRAVFDEGMPRSKGVAVRTPCVLNITPPPPATRWWRGVKTSVFYSIICRTIGFFLPCIIYCSVFSLPCLAKTECGVIYEVCLTQTTYAIRASVLIVGVLNLVVSSSTGVESRLPSQGALSSSVLLYVLKKDETSPRCYF